MVADPHAPAQLADAQQRTIRGGHMHDTLQYFDRDLTKSPLPA
jgi:hypothetical protein